jgi:acyl-CoA synthetase (AMP-forming)/AMP-acid ligase II
MLPQCRSYEEISRAFRWRVPERFNIGVEVCDRWADRDPRKLAIVAVDAGGGVREFGYGWLRETSNRLANVLAAHGVGRGDRVAILLPQMPEVAAIHVARRRSGDDDLHVRHDRPPKGALHAHRVLLGHMPGIELPHDFFPQPGDRFWTPADWAWAGGLLNVPLAGLYFGVPVVARRFDKFDPEEAFALMARHGVRNAFIPPTALRMLRAAPNPRGATGCGCARSGPAARRWARRPTSGAAMRSADRSTSSTARPNAISCRLLRHDRRGAGGRDRQAGARPRRRGDRSARDGRLPPANIGQIAVRGRTR